MVALDITYGRPELVSVRDAARVLNNWRALSHALTDGVVDGEDRSDRFAVAAATIVGATGAMVPPGIDEWLAAEPYNPTAVLLRGAVEVLRGWKIRGRALARHTSPQRLRDFVRVLGYAESLCRAAAQLAPADPTPWVYLLQMARGQQVGFRETLDRLGQLSLRAPNHLGGYFQAVYSMSPMWGTPPEMMKEQVSKWTAAAPAGSPLHCLVFVANFEWWRRNPRANGHLFRNKELRAEGERAADLLTMEPCRRPADYLAHNHAAAWFSQVPDRRRALAHFRLLEGRRTQWPWGYMHPVPGLVFRGRRLAAWLRLP